MLTSREAVALQRETAGGDDLALASALNSAANNEASDGNLPQSEALRREALALWRKHPGSDDPRVADSLTNLARALYDHGAYPEAGTMLHEALAIERKLPEGNAKYSALNGTAGLLIQIMVRQGDQAGAETLGREILDLVEKNSSPNLDAIGIARLHLAAVLKQRGNLAGAEAETREELAIWERLYGRNSGQFAGALVRLALLLQERGDLGQAEPLLREAVARTRELSEDHLRAIQPLRRLAGLQAAQGNLPGAIASLREAVDLCRQHLPEMNPALPDCLRDLAVDLQAQGNFGAAEKLLAEAWALEQSLHYFRVDEQHQLHENFAKLYAAWTKTDPTKAGLATDWQQKLAAFTRDEADRKTTADPRFK